MDQRDFAGRMRVRVARGRRAMGRPAGVRNADIAGCRIAGEFLDEVVELPLRTAADQLAVKHGAHARAVITAILHSPKAIDQTVCHCFLADDTNNATHLFCFLWSFVWNADTRHFSREVLCISCDQDPA